MGQILLEMILKLHLYFMLEILPFEIINYDKMLIIFCLIPDLMCALNVKKISKT